MATVTKLGLYGGPTEGALASTSGKTAVAFTGPLQLDSATTIPIRRDRSPERSEHPTRGARSQAGNWRSSRTPQAGRKPTKRWPLETPSLALADALTIETVLLDESRHTAEGWAVGGGPVTVYVSDGPHRIWDRDSTDYLALRFTLEVVAG